MKFAFNQRTSRGRDPAGIVQIILLVLTVLCTACSAERARVGVLAADGSLDFTLMEFSTPLDLNKLPEGWSHHIFLRHDPMDISFVEKDGRAAIRLATHDTASMLFRQVDILIDRYPILSWEWLIEQGIDVEHDKRSVAGDDHSARLFLRFEDNAGERRSMQIVWGGRQLGPGDRKDITYLFGQIGPYRHYVANGGAENVGRWHPERVNLGEIYRDLLGDPAGVRLIEIALFCDTDETGASSIAYFGPIEVHQR